jgi:small subunit ribosomal protein S4
MRYTGPVCKLCKACGEKLFLKGDRCFSSKCPIVRKSEKRRTPTRSRGRRRRLSDYGVRLAEKQKLRRIYGLGEKSFKRLFDMASQKKGITGEILLSLLERRLDNVVFRMGFATSRAHARQLVLHKFFNVGGRKVSIPSYIVEEGDTIEVAPSKQENLKNSIPSDTSREIPKWLSVNKKKFSGEILRIPERDEITVPVEESLIVEFYSR